MRWTTIVASVLLISLSSASAHWDSVIWSSQPLGDKSVQDIVGSASAESPLVIYAVNDFSLAMFSKNVGAYDNSPPKTFLAQQVSSAKYQRTEAISKVVELPSDALTNVGSFTAGRNISFFKLSTWADLEEAYAVVTNGEKSSLTSIISSPKAFAIDSVEERKKRQLETASLSFPNDDTVEESALKPQPQKRPMLIPNDAADALQLPMPVVLPPVNVTGSNYTITGDERCLFYLEGITIVLYNSRDVTTARDVIIDSANGSNSFNWGPAYANCAGLSNMTVGEAIFDVVIVTSAQTTAVYDTDRRPVFTVAAGTIEFQLTFRGGQDGYWKLTDVTLRNLPQISPAPDSTFLPQALTVTTPVSTNQTKFMGVESFYQYGYACSSTQAAFFKADAPADWLVGIGLYNFEVDLKPYARANAEGRVLAFNRDVYDCVGSFSVGSWMGIVCSLVLASILMFGYLMLQSVQTMDRFDDPKQKQIVINFKE